MAVIKTSTGRAQEVATATGAMTTAAGSRQAGVAPTSYPSATPITGADTKAVLLANGLQEVYSPT